MSDVVESIKQLQQIELSILLDVKEVCDKHNLRFFLGEGTMIGAIRHHGVIPWDDDIDVIMPREDYEKFLKVAPNELKRKYEVQHASTVDKYWSPFIKVRLLEHDGKFSQYHIAHLTKNNGPYVDIFPIEYSDSKEGFGVKMTFIMVSLCRGMLSLKMKLRKPKNTKEKIVKFLSNFVSVEMIHAMLNRTLAPYSKPGKKYMATFLTYHPLKCLICEAKNYDETVMVDFEGYKMPVPGGYHEILSTIYGDYMTPPPADQRIMKHHFYDAD
jgi:lipopolysaccharide cholinephosphotransferase